MWFGKVYTPEAPPKPALDSVTFAKVILKSFSLLKVKHVVKIKHKSNHCAACGNKNLDGESATLSF